MLTPIPLLILPLAIYNILTFLTPGLDWQAVIARVRLPSDAVWSISVCDAFLAFSLFILLIETIKATRAASRGAVDHGLAIILLLITLSEFLMVQQVATSVFALMAAMMIFDVIAGLWISRRIARLARFEG